MVEVPVFDTALMHSFRGVWALSSLKKDGLLRADFYVWPIVYGRDPLWVVYSSRGRFVRYASGRAQIARWYPSLTWRRAMCRWTIVDVQNHSVTRRTEEFEQLTGKAAPKREKKES